MGYTFEDIEVKFLGEAQGKSNYQDYREIRKSLKPGQSWKDPEFSGDDPNTLGKKASSNLIYWKRPKELTLNPVFAKGKIGEKYSRFDIKQGALSDCWLLVAIDVIAEQPCLLQMVVPEDNTFEDDNSVFHFRFWKAGTWVDVVIDDTLPCYTAYENYIPVTKVAFANNRSHEYWVPLLEKAYAKLYGTYSMLQFGMIGDALVDLTGGICRTLTIRAPTSETPKQILNYMVDSYERGSLIGMGILLGTSNTGEALDTDFLLNEGQLGAGEVKMENGLAKGHAYSVTGLGQVDYEGRNLLLVRVRNPWGTEFEWNGAWSDKSEEWSAFNKDKVEALNLKNDDGEFWMNYRDVQKNFDLLSVCHLPANTLKKIVPPVGKHAIMWTNHEFDGIWPGAGGSNTVELFKNPQYLLDLTINPHEQIKVILSLFNKSISLTGKGTSGQSFFLVIYTVKALSSYITKRFRPSDVDSRMLVQTAIPSLEDMRESFEMHLLEKGRYLVIPSSGTVRGTSGTFLLRVFTDGPSNMIQLE